MTQPHNAGQTIVVEQVSPMPIKDRDWGPITVHENWGRLFITWEDRQIIVVESHYPKLVAAIQHFIRPSTADPAMARFDNNRMAQQIFDSEKALTDLCVSHGMRPGGLPLEWLDATLAAGLAAAKELRHLKGSTSPAGIDPRPEAPSPPTALFTCPDCNGELGCKRCGGYGLLMMHADLTPPAADYVAGLEAALATAKAYLNGDLGDQYSLDHFIRALAARPASPDTRVEPLEFGIGTFVVDTGSYGEKPAVFISPAKYPGEVGASAKRENHPLNALIAGDMVMTFPTSKQAKIVADALCNASTAPSNKIAEAAQTDTALREAIGRAWCHEENVAKEMDVDLAEAVLWEIRAILDGGQDRG